MAQRSLAGLLSVLCFLVVWCGTCSAQEMLQNPDFEAGPPEGVPEGWELYGGGVPESQLEMCGDAHSGHRAVRLLDTGPNERDGRWSVGLQQRVAVEGGKHYLASVWAKCAARNHDHALNLQFTFQPSQRVYVTRVTPPIGGDWQRFTVVGQAEPGDTSVMVYLYTMHYWTGDFVVDDASMTQVSAEVYGDKLPLAYYGAAGLDTVRPLNLRTPLVQGDAAAAIICVPRAEAWQAAGKQLQAGIRERTGVELPLTTDARSLLSSDRTVIAIGNLNNNFIVERLHWNKYLVADSLTPGPGKYVLRTVHEPFNFLAGLNVLTIEASDPAGATAGVEALLGLLPQSGDIVLEAPMLVNPNYAPLNESAKAALLAEPLSRDPWVDFWRNAELYRDRGDLAYAEKAKQVLFQIADLYQRQPGYAVTWPEETSSNHVGAAWDVLEECPVFSEADRLRASNTLLALCYCLPRHTSGWGQQANNDTITWNHTTFPLLGIYWLARYFERWYGDLDGKIAFAMGEVRGCFRGQKKSWKPQCDADSYLTIVPQHLMEYTLAENDYEWFENGNCRKFAEYLTAVSDNRGALPGFGDSGYSTAPGYELAGLPMALWYYRDGRYLWRLQQTLKGNWQNPYDPSVQPVKWYSMAGLKVTRLHPENYNYTSRFSYYGEPLEPPNVPFAKAFDKITFRENLTPDSEFMLLDGYARGKHLHYDGNAIIKFYADGEDWLIDGDYLVRNTTEHNMLSVVRDGRCEQYIPVCTSLEHYADFEKGAFTQTRVYGYNGVNWTRHIAWLKGQCFVVIDECEALHDGDYAFEVVWKTLDRGRQELVDGRVFSTVVEGAGGVGSRGLKQVNNPTPDVPTAVRFVDARSQLEFGLDLPKGNYEVTLFAYGLNTGADSFWLSVDGGEPVAFHIPVKAFGPSSSAHTKDTPTPNVAVPTDGPHRFSITLREAPGVMLDRVLVRNEQGETVADFQAENAPPLPASSEKPAPQSRFFIKSDGAAASQMSTWVNAVGLHIRKLHQRFGGAMKAGERASSMTVFYNDKTDAPKNFDIRRIATGTALILKDDKPWGVFSTDTRGLGLPPDLSNDAAMLMITSSHLYVVDVSRMGRQDVYTDAPVSAELDLDYGYGFVQAQKATKVHLPGGMEADIWEGGLTFDTSMIGDTSLLTGLKLLPAIASARAMAPPAATGEPAPDLGLTVAWRTDPVTEDDLRAPVMALQPADLDGDGSDEIIVLRGSVALCMEPSGQVRWEFAAEGLLRAVCVADLEQDGAPEVLVGGDDERVYILNPQGQELRRLQVTTPVRVGTSSVHQPQVANLCVGDLDLDGTREIIVGTRNGNIARYDVDLNLVWACDTIEHGTRDMVLVNLDDDPKLEVVAANRYGAVEVVSASGQARAGVYSELGDVEMAIGDLNGDGKLEVANGSSTGAFVCQTYGENRLFEFPNYGYGVRGVRIVTPAPGAPPRVAIASETGFLYMLDQAGNVLAQRRLGTALLCLSVIEVDGQARLLTGGRDGRLYELDTNLNVTRHCNCGWAVDRIAVIGRAGQAPLIMAAGEGQVAALTRL